ncbi:MAG: DNA-binding response regulator [Myxococcales bacterium]|nr:DNA-binding response regulator [Myxococcales bacterium]|tara:strand:- start:523 stop:1143 length:621 start_codon:yes stop_codon:yes gene_type:complete
MAETIRVYVVEDHTIVREGIIALIETTDDLQVVGESSDGRTALAGISELKPDVVLCDLALPGLGGLEVIKRVLQTGINTRFVVLTMYHDHAWVQRAMEAGAAGYVLKGAGVRDVVNAVRTVARGDTFLTPGTRLATSKDPLSSREIEVLTLLAEGHTSREIGQLLDISGRTAEHHRAKIMKKLGINDVAGLVRYAIRNGLVDQNLK